MAATFCLLLALWLLGAMADAPPTELETCYPTDYVRKAGECDASGMRLVRYERARKCSDPFPVAPAGHKEPCDCTPQDYVADYKPDDQTCHLIYTPANCTGGVPSAPLVVSEEYCVVENVPCLVENIRTTYTSCEYLRNETTNAIITGTMEVVYYFDDACNPNAPGSVRLPPAAYMSCDQKCGAGAYVKGQRCVSCPNGKFSVGGGVRMEVFEDVLLKFQANCSFSNSSGQQTCAGWHASGGAMVVGPFDFPNDLFPNECADDVNNQCHNNLKAFLMMTVRLIRDGSVTFNYTVNAEKEFDGLLFYVDMEPEPRLPLDSYQFRTKTVQFNLSEGYHTLRWEYVKNEQFTRGSDQAKLMLIEVDGTGLNDKDCTPCPPGYYSGVGASACTACPPNTFSEMEGSSACQPCENGTYSQELPRTSCTARPACDLTTDASISYGPCKAATNTRQKTYKWLLPHICQPNTTNELPPATEEPCGECPPGQYGVVNSTAGTKGCQNCPTGETRAAGQEACARCPAGQAAVRELSLSRFEAAPAGGDLPAGFATICDGDCGSSGWRAANGVLDSGTGHGATVEVWLALNVTLEMDGEVSFTFSVDIPQDDLRRKFGFYIDDDLYDTVQDFGYEDEIIPKEPTVMGPAALAAGRHTLLWLYLKVDPDTDHFSRDTVIIYNITVRGEVGGSAPACVDVPQGAEALPSGSAWRDCPAGQYSDGGVSVCTPCPANTYNPRPLGANLTACKPCRPGTSSPANASECTIGDAAVPSSFCTYSPPAPAAVAAAAAANESAGGGIVLYDLSPLARQKAVYGPILENPALHRPDDGAKFWVSVCNKQLTNATCFDRLGGPLDTYICRVYGKTSSYSGPVRPADSLGNTVELLPLGDSPATQRRGLVMRTFGNVKCMSGTLRDVNLTFVCDPPSGYGQPEPWWTGGLRKVFDPTAPFPWLARTGTPTKVNLGRDFCHFAMVWYTAFACPLCTEHDYEAVHIQGCVDNVRTTFRYREPKVCQENAQARLPPDVLCAPCTAADYEVDETECRDAGGARNRTHRWLNPKVCSEGLPGAAALPPDVRAGPCVQNVTVVAGGLPWWQWALVALGGVLLVASLAFTLVTWLRSRRLYSAYSKLVANGNMNDFALDEEDGPDGPEGNGGGGRERGVRSVDS